MPVTYQSLLWAGAMLAIAGAERNALIGEGSTAMAILILPVASILAMRTGRRCARPGEA